MDPRGRRRRQRVEPKSVLSGRTVSSRTFGRAASAFIWMEWWRTYLKQRPFRAAAAVGIHTRKNTVPHGGAADFDPHVINFIVVVEKARVACGVAASPHLDDNI